MTVIKRRIKAPVLDSELVANNTMKQYMQDIELFMLDAGLVKSSSLDNIDVLEPPLFPWEDSRVNNVFMPNSLSYDLNDVHQAEFPIRIKFRFGWYKYSSTSYPRRFFMYTSVGVIDATTNDLDPSRSKHAVSYIHDYSGHTSDPTINMDYGLASFINVKEGFVCVCINPGFGSYIPGVIGARGTNAFLIIERNFDDTYTYNGTGCNVIMRNTDSTTSASAALDTTAISTGPNIVTDTNMIFANTSGFLADGQLITYPVMHINNGANLIQTPNMVITNSRAVGTAQPIELVIEGVTKKFEGIYSSIGTYPVSSEATLLVTSE